MTPRRATVALALVAILSTASLIPLTFLVGTAQAAPQTSEGLANPSLEGPATAANGFTISGASETAPVPRSGLQSVNLAAAGGLRDADGTLGTLDIRATTPIALHLVREFSFYHNVPGTISATNITHGLRMSVPNVGDYCLVHPPVALAVTSGWVRIAANNASTYGVAAASCTGPMTNRTLLDIQDDAAYAGATITNAWVKTQPSVVFWPAGRPIYVDDASIRAFQSPLVRIQNDADNLCNGASFGDIASGLECAASGATVLVAPHTYVGNFTVTKPVTLCATGPGGTACQSGRTDVRIEGASTATPTLVRIRSDDVNFRGFTLSNANYTTVNAPGAAVQPTLLTVEGDRVNVSDNRLQQAASTPGPTQTRTRAIGINVISGADIIVTNNTISAMPPSLGANGACDVAPCQTEGIRLVSASGLAVIEGNVINLAGTRQAAGVSFARADVRINNNTILLPAFTGTNVGIETTKNDPPAHIEGNQIGRAAGEVNRPAYGITGAFIGATIRGNTLQNLGTAIRLFGPTSARDHIESNIITNTDLGVLIAGDDIHLNANVMTGVTTAVRVQGGFISTLTMRDNRFGGPPTSLDLASSITGATVDARENDWGHYTLSAIRASITDASTGTALDISCFIESDGITRNCPPTADFSWSPITPSWRHAVNFTSLAQPGSNALVAWAWTFGDGETAATRNASHPYAAPGTRTVELAVTDAQGYVVKVTKNIDIINHAPEFVPLGTPSGRENITIRFVVNATDADNDPLVFRADGLPSGASFNATNRTFTWAPTFADEGNHSATFTVNDSLVEVTYVVPIAVGDSNAPPYLLPVGHKAGRENEPLEFLVHATDADIPANASQRLRLHAFTLPYTATFVDWGNGTGIFRWTPSYQQSGVHNLTIEANDGTLEVREIIKLTIEDVNRAPVLAPIADKTVVETEKLTFTVTASDLDGDVMTFGASQLPAGAKFNSSPTKRLFEWVPTHDQGGQHVATFTVSDGKVTSFLNVTILVLEKNRAPYVNSGQNYTLLANRTILFHVTGGDLDGHPITMGVVEMPPNATFNNATRVMSWRTSASDVGTHAIMFFADDGELRGYGPRYITVAENLPPVIALTGPTLIDIRQTAQFSGAGTFDPGTGASVSYQWDFDDRDGFTPQATGMTSSWVFTTPGHHNVTLRAQDTDGFVSTKRLEVVVDDVADLTLELLQPPSATSATAIRARFHLSDGSPIANVVLTVTTYYQPAANAGRLFERTFTATTDDQGVAIYVVPREGTLVNLPGRHVVSAVGTAPTSYLGNEETGSGTLDYSYLL